MPPALSISFDKNAATASPGVLPARKSALAQKFARVRAYVGYGMQMIPQALLPIWPNRAAVGELRVADCTVRYYRHWPACSNLIHAWDELSKRVADMSPFQSPHWQNAIARYADSMASLRLLTVHRNNQLVAVMPLERKRHGNWVTPGRMTTDYLDPLIAPEEADRAWGALLQGVRHFAGDSLRAITLDLVSPESNYAEKLAPIAAREGFTIKDEIASVATAIPLAQTWDEYLARLKAHDRKELRRKIRKAEEKGNARFVVNETTLSVEFALKNVFTLMEINGGGKGRKAKWLFRPHFKIAAPKLAQDGRMVVYELYIENQLAAGLIALPCKDRQILWCGAINARLKEWSPGIVLFGMVFRRAIEKGQPMIDLLRGQYPYKYTMGAVDRPLHRITLLAH